MTLNISISETVRVWDIVPILWHAIRSLGLSVFCQEQGQPQAEPIETPQQTTAPPTLDITIKEEIDTKEALTE